MNESTRRLWMQQDRHPGDRQRLFAAVAAVVGDVEMLYPGSFVDVAASFVFSSVTYVDNDARAARFFADETGVGEIVERGRTRPGPAEWRFIWGDYRVHLDVPDASVGVLVSLYAGFVSEHCTRYLRPGGWLLVNPSHGDAAMASIDPDYSLQGVLTARAGGYTARMESLDEYLVPKRSTRVSREMLHRRGRGIAYTRSPFAYLFRRSVPD